MIAWPAKWYLKKWGLTTNQSFVLHLWVRRKGRSKMINYTGCTGNHKGVPQCLRESIFSGSLGHSLWPVSWTNIYLLYLLFNVLCLAQGKQAPSDFHRPRNSWNILHRKQINDFITRWLHVWGNFFFVPAYVPWCPWFGVWTWDGSNFLVATFLFLRRKTAETSFEFCWHHLQKLSSCRSTGLSTLQGWPVYTIAVTIWVWFMGRCM